MVELSSLYKLHIVMLTKNNVEYVRTCVDSIIEKKLFGTGVFTNYQFYIGDTGSSDYGKEKLKEYYDKVTRSINSAKIKSIIFDGFQYSKVNNYVAQNELDLDNSKTNLVLFLNNDVKMLSDCVTQLVQAYHDNKDSVGTVGCKLLFEDGTLQHAGQCIRKHVHTGQRGAVSGFVPTHRGLNRAPTQFSNTETVLGNTGAVMLISLDLFNKVGGFREEFDHYFQDAHLCMKCIDNDKQNIYVGQAVAYHFEHKTHSPTDMQKLGERCSKDLNGFLSNYIQERQDKFKDFIINT